jgi:hypothetical protein
MASKQIHLTTSADGLSVTLQLPEATLSLNATDVDNLLLALSSARGAMQPSFPDQPAPNQEYQATTDPRYWVMPNQVLGGTNIGFRHPGYGWIWFCVSNAETQHLANILKAHNAAAPPAGSSAIN